MYYTDNDFKIFSISHIDMCYDENSIAHPDLIYIIQYINYISRPKQEQMTQSSC